MAQVAVYARVSTVSKGQEVENQLIQLRAYCQRQGWEFTEYVDHASAGSRKRPEFQRLLLDASKRLFSIVLVWKLDRFTREGVYETFGYIEQLKKYSVDFESYTEPHFRTNGPAGELMMAVAAWIAKQERTTISERCKAGLERARKQGKVLGRPRRIFNRDEAKRLHEQGFSLRQIGKMLHVSNMTVKRSL